ncbi:glyoxylate/hydroxypyruvate reductase A [Jannaschia sp. LMIT008]|uniref:2-hydroxyacid dehydrogenase n=1 Tax=Jannaschia maritima TaxID=3032585 RepID=UPI002810D672|nr:glyoxylate/hydroxypyruvate reductase A [Jannaschia sp. LMIT008]
MTVRVLFAGRDAGWDEWAPHLRDAFAEAGLDVAMVPVSRDHDPAAFDWMIHSPKGPVEDFAPYTGLKGVLSLWAGVERVEGNPTLTVPLTRMVDDSLVQGMVEWVTGHVLRHHLGMDAHIVNPDRAWDGTAPPLAPDRRVAVLGLGALGAPCATTLAGLGFDVTGWTRKARSLDGVRCLHGPEARDDALAEAEIVVLLMPHTSATQDMVDEAFLAAMAPGAVLLNPARGALVVEDDLLDALDRGHLSHATLDTHRVEPLPPDHPFWSHPRVTVTPHVASHTRPGVASKVIAENVRRGEAGEPLLHVVDRSEAMAGR